MTLTAYALLALVLVAFLRIAAKHRPAAPVVTDKCTPTNVLRERQRRARAFIEAEKLKPCWSTVYGTSAHHPSVIKEGVPVRVEQRSEERQQFLDLISRNAIDRWESVRFENGGTQGGIQ